MPRIEIVPAGWHQSRDKARGEGTPTIDVCLNCSTAFTEGMPLDQGDGDHLTEQYPGADIGSTDVAHPPYSDLDYTCEVCDCKLDDSDN